MGALKRVGLLVNPLGWEGSYTNLLWRSAITHCHHHGIQLVVYSGPQQVEDYVSQRTHAAVFRLIDPRRIDGLILNPGLKYYASGALLPDYPREFASIPMVSIAEAVPGVPSILVDNASGMAQLVRHLVEAHGYHRQVFVVGPEGSQDGGARLAAWRQTLHDLGIAPESEFLLHGNFITVNDAHRLIEAWAQGRRWDVVVASSDLMAMDLIQTLGRAGILVPQDLAVVGFDDNHLGRYTDPPLTTVHQPITLQVATAIDALVEIWNGRVPQAQTVLSSRLVVRSSCGCSLERWSTEESLKAILSESIRKPKGLLESLQNTIGQADHPTDRAFDAWIALDHLARSQESLSPDINGALDAVRRYLFLQTATHLRVGMSGERLSEHGSRSVFEALWSADIGTLGTSLAETLPLLGVEHYCLSLLPGLLGEVQGPSTFIAVAIRPSPVLAEATRAFDPTLLAPTAWWETLDPSALVVLPIVSQSTWYGLLLADLNPGNEEVLLQIQSAIAFLCDRDSRVARTHRQKTLEWTRSQEQTEKNRVIADLVRGVAHEINTPLGVSVTLASYIAGQLDELDQNYLSGQLSKVFMAEFLANGHQGLDQLNRNLVRAADLVNTFKKVSVSQFSEEMSPCDLAQELEYVLCMTNTELKARFIAVQRSLPENLVLNTRRSMLHEVAANLVQNVMDHAFPPGWEKQPVLTLSASISEPENLVRIEVTDNGKGIAPDVLPRIYDAFFTTKRSQGSVGLGLAIVTNLVCDGLGGTIRCATKSGEGTSFVLELPFA